MKTWKVLLLVVSVALAALLVLPTSFAQVAPAPAAATRIAVCDVIEIFGQYQKAKDLTSKMNEKNQALQAESDKRTKAIEALQMELDALKEGSKEYEQRYRQIQQQTYDQQAWIQMEKKVALREHARLTREMYEDINKTISAVAKQRGFDVVLQKTKADLDAENTQQLAQQIQSRQVLFTTDSCDITDVVLLQLNQAYRAGSETK